jgi:hypothetical protein
VRTRLLLTAAAALPLSGWAHGFDERHDLPAPLTHFMAGAALAVALSFLLAVFFARSAPANAPGRRADGDAAFTLPASLCLTVRLASLLLFAVTVAAALVGTADPMMNLAPTLVWIVWWVGLSLLVACIGNIWPLLDPWATLFDGADALARRFGARSGIALDWSWPVAVGAWPAVVLLLAWSWLEIVYPLAAVPWRVGCAALAWTAVTLLGMLCFGRERWRSHGDVFAVYFGLLGRMAPFAMRSDGRGVVVRAPGSALIAPSAGRGWPAGGVAFVLAMLSTVLFDGLHGSQAWPWFEGVLARVVPQGAAVGPKVAGTAGLVLVWLVFLLAYGGTCWITAKAGGGESAAAVAREFAPTLVPIAVGYNVAHNFSSLVEQGQNMLYLLSDPFGWQWNLFGTAQLHTRSGLVDARMTWYVAIAMVVLGHCIGVWLAHRVALRDRRRPLDAVRHALPLVLLMLAYTAISLFVIAEPMVQYLPPTH